MKALLCLALVVFLGRCAYALPSFTHAPSTDSSVSSVKATLYVCATTADDTDVIEWQVYNEQTQQYETAFAGQCLTVPTDLGITTEEQLGDSQSVTYRPCATDEEGIVCADPSHYEILGQVKKEMLLRDK